VLIDLEHRRAHQPGQVGHGAEPEHQRRHQHVPHRAPAGHRQQRAAEQVVHVHQRELAEGGEHEARHRDTENHQEHDDHVRQAVAVQGGERAPQHAAQRGEDDGEDAEGGRDREVLADDVVHLAVLLGERDAEVAAQQVAHVDQVLLAQGLVQAVLGLEVGADVGSHRRSEVPGDRPAR
jgi:hypothetical protein